MRYKNKQAFTFVELIVVMTIMAILSTIGFGVYQSYLSGGRDTNRLVQLKDIHDGLERYSVNSRLPFPEDMIEIQANGNTFAYQGYAGDGVIKAIGYDGGGKDTEHGTYLTYMLGDNQRDFQLMTYIVDPGLLSQNIIVPSYASAIDYELLYPKVTGSPLGIMIDIIEQTPLQSINTIKSVGKYDIVSGTGTLKAYYSDTNYIDSTQESLTQIIGDQSCQRILQLGNSKGNGIYTISPLGSARVKVYCDMEIDSGGWTLVARSSETASSENFGWLESIGNPENMLTLYSLGDEVKDIFFDQILTTTFTGAGDIDASWIAEAIDSSVVKNELTTSESLIGSCTIITNTSLGETPICFTYWGEIDRNDAYTFKRTANTGQHGLRNNGYSSSPNFLNSMRDMQGMIFIR
ncbi:prepilin-type N-terminal cleavage/methylation domain-containing protein [Candidatus Gracilibacteria bacterium]|nr:prepilin-type N-terminal cleavage/methylation domain-containing protein [Candidatus Gracilibacteria bacterium]